MPHAKKCFQRSWKWRLFARSRNSEPRINSTVLWKDWTTTSTCFDQNFKLAGFLWPVWLSRAFLPTGYWIGRSRSCSSQLYSRRRLLGHVDHRFSLVNWLHFRILWNRDHWRSTKAPAWSIHEPDTRYLEKMLPYSFQLILRFVTLIATQ